MYLSQTWYNPVGTRILDMISRITASESSMDTVWFVMVTSEEETSNMEVKNHYGNILEPFFEKETNMLKSIVKETYIYKFTIV